MTHECNPDYKKLAEAYHIKGLFVDSEQDLDAALAEFLDYQVRFNNSFGEAFTEAAVIDRTQNNGGIGSVLSVFPAVHECCRWTQSRQSRNATGPTEFPQDAHVGILKAPCLPTVAPGKAPGASTASSDRPPPSPLCPGEGRARVPWLPFPLTGHGVPSPSAQFSARTASTTSTNSPPGRPHPPAREHPEDAVPADGRAREGPARDDSGGPGFRGGQDAGAVVMFCRIVIVSREECIPRNGDV